MAASQQGALTNTNEDFLQYVGDAVFAGEKGDGGASTANLDPAGIATVRSDKVWYLDVTDAGAEGGEISLRFDLGQLGLETDGSVSDYVMLWRSDQSGQFYEVAVADALADGSITFNDLAIDHLVANGVIGSSTDILKDGYITVGVRYTSAAEYQSLTEDGSTQTVTLTLDEFLNEASAPDAPAFTLEIAGSARNVTSVTIDGKDVTVTYDGAALTSADSLSVTYNTPASGLRLEDQTGNDVSDFNVIKGAAGDDTLTGNAGDADAFVYSDVADGSDTINDFTVADGDVLDLASLLDYAVGDSLSDYLTVTDDGTDVSLAIDVDGAGGADITLTLTGIGTGSLALADLEQSFIVL